MNETGFASQWAAIPQRHADEFLQRIGEPEGQTVTLHVRCVPDGTTVVAVGAAGRVYTERFGVDEVEGPDVDLWARMLERVSARAAS